MFDLNYPSSVNFDSVEATFHTHNGNGGGYVLGRIRLWFDDGTDSTVKTAKNTGNPSKTEDVRLYTQGKKVTKLRVAIEASEPAGAKGGATGYCKKLILRF